MRRIRITTSDTQRQLLRGGSQALFERIREPVIGAAVLSLIYGLLIISTSNPAKFVFEVGMYEHIAKITLPLAIPVFLFLFGLSIAIRRTKFINVLSLMRYSMTSVGVLIIDLMSIVFGVLVGITIPSMIVNGPKIAIGYGLLGSVLLVVYILIVFAAIKLPYVHWNYNKYRKYIPKLGIILSVLAVIIFYFILQELILEMEKQ